MELAEGFVRDLHFVLGKRTAFLVFILDLVQSVAILVPPTNAKSHSNELVSPTLLIREAGLGVIDPAHILRSQSGER